MSNDFERHATSKIIDFVSLRLAPYMSKKETAVLLEKQVFPKNSSLFFILAWLVATKSLKIFFCLSFLLWVRMNAIVTVLYLLVHLEGGVYVPTKLPGYPAFLRTD